MVNETLSTKQTVVALWNRLGAAFLQLQRAHASPGPLTKMQTLSPQAGGRGRDSAFLASAWWGRCCCLEYQGPRRTGGHSILIPDLWHQLCSLHFIPRAWRSPPPHPEPCSSAGPKNDRIHKIQRLLAPLRSEPVEVKHRLPYKFFSELRPSTWFIRIIFQPVLELWSERGQRGFCVV